MKVFAAHVAPCRLWLGLLARLSLFERGSSKLDPETLAQHERRGISPVVLSRW